MLENLTALNLILLGVAMFASGFIDAIAGGGGLIQTPAMLLSFPDRNPVEVVATSKTAAFFGTTTAAIQYRKFIKTDPKLLIAMVIPAFIGSGIGAHLASRISAGSYKSSIFFVMIAIFFYTLVKPELGKEHVEKHSPQKLMVIGSVAAFIIGFYDGLIGPGTGTILMIALVALMGFAFVGASAIAKVVNATTNLASIIVVGLTIGVMWKLGLVLAVANLAGGYMGSHMAIKKGSSFIRIFYLIVTGLLILRLGYSLYLE
ncbi:TauE superfamily protein [Candidatus Planktophila dulcis]|uniref:Probable membrane transporter protein n=1 Tax=Candidatus Planktophila dulcis TaxID=1884914 RepID=A0AAD0E607_9ACTN|nr:TSUP family transporter [Candidatus Planktophila dulcis]ASY12215.1 TauE superfamily protein [Candidatus Planktophila dulcis]ASY21462.1 TauE superfamily protein [Candidatus Planktophila dulcis]